MNDQPPPSPSVELHDPPVPAQRAASGSPDTPQPNLEYLWRAYGRVQQHYEIDLQLFSVRMNMFLLIQSALIALFGGTAKFAGIVHFAPAVASFGLAMAIGWFCVACSSYMWVKTWRAQLIKLGISLDAAHLLNGPDEKDRDIPGRNTVPLDVYMFSRLFDRTIRHSLHAWAFGGKAPQWQIPKGWEFTGREQRLWRLSERLSWFVRPTLVTSCLPLIFIGAWCYFLASVV